MYMWDPFNDITKNNFSLCYVLLSRSVRLDKILDQSVINKKLLSFFLLHHLTMKASFLLSCISLLVVSTKSERISPRAGPSNIVQLLISLFMYTQYFFKKNVPVHRIKFSAMVESQTTQTMITIFIY